MTPYDELVQKQLPAFVEAVDRGTVKAGLVVVAVENFDETPSEVFLMGCAVRYAASRGVEVVVLPTVKDAEEYNKRRGGIGSP